MTHTPGPWTAEPRDDGADGFIVRDADGEFVNYLCDSRYGDGRKDPTAEVNARLIAAAPELYEALRALLDGPGDGFGHPSEAERQKARAALAKVKGEA